MNGVFTLSTEIVFVSSLGNLTWASFGMKDRLKLVYKACQAFPAIPGMNILGNNPLLSLAYTLHDIPNKSLRKCLRPMYKRLTSVALYRLRKIVELDLCISTVAPYEYFNAYIQD